MSDNPSTNPEEEDSKSSGSAVDKGSSKQLEEIPKSFPEFFNSASAVGMVVFLITSFGALVFLFLVNIGEFTGSGNDYRLFRSIEIVLTLSALGIVVLFLSRQPSPLVATFSIFVVGALIIPSKDIVRFALIVSGSEKSIEDFFGTGIVGPNLQGRSDDAAAKIVSEVLNFDGYSTDARPDIAEAQRGLLVKRISRRIYQERVVTILERVKSRGAFELLLASETGFQDFLYKHSSHEKFIDDLRFLRSEDLISFAYDDLESVRVTLTGGDVLRWASSGELASSRTPGSVGFDRNFLPVVEPVVIPDVDSVAECTSSVFGGSSIREIELQADGEDYSSQIQIDYAYNWLELRVEEGRYEIQLYVEETSPIDPFIALLYRDNEVCRYIIDDDDGGSALNSRIIVELATGEYVLGVRSLRDVGEATLAVSKQ